jgi:putative pyruvate formate lyase activating enzyme
MPEVSLVGLHHWEEPSISGSRGSGTVFFPRCNLRCVFCQNHEISQGGRGQAMTPERLARAFISLQERGAHNVNLVSPTHYSRQVASAIRISRELGLVIPIVYNSNGYESPEALSCLDGLVDVYLPDLKYCSDALALRYSSAPDYFAHATRAILEMSRQVGVPRFDDEGVIVSGLIVRHLVLPGCSHDSSEVLKWFATNLPRGTYLSLMSQYYPTHKAGMYPELNRRLRKTEYDGVLEAMSRLGISDGYVQGLSSASSAYKPDFSRSNESVV